MRDFSTIVMKTLYGDVNKGLQRAITVLWHLHLLPFYWHALASWQLSYALVFLLGFVLLY